MTAVFSPPTSNRMLDPIRFDKPSLSAQLQR